jgi:hypothetical protein
MDTAQTVNTRMGAAYPGPRDLGGRTDLATLLGAMQRIYALWVLAWGLLRSMFTSFTGQRRGLSAFRESYAADRLPSVSAEDRRVLPTFNGCIACGQCNIGEGDAILRSGGRYRGVMDLMLASSRSMPDYDAASASFQAVGNDRLKDLEARCPTGVPMRKIADFVKRKARETVREV